jgi:pilus assembly protein CpaC
MSASTCHPRQTGGFQFGLAQGRNPGAYTIGAGPVSDARCSTPQRRLPSRHAYACRSTGQFINPRGTGIAYITKRRKRHLGAGRQAVRPRRALAIDLGETIGQVTTLANPNLTALSGETATFLAGGEIPIPIARAWARSRSNISSTASAWRSRRPCFPTAASRSASARKCRSSTSAGAVSFGTTIPALSTRRSETTVELGSGESMVIGGLLQNSHNNSIDKTPGLGDVPVLGALFRSNGFQRNETELVIVITPYLVKPVNANQIVLPTDGYKAPDDFERILIGGQLSGSGTTGGERPKPTMAPGNGQPAVGAFAPVPAHAPQQRPSRRCPSCAAPAKTKKGGSAAPGFGF